VNQKIVALDDGVSALQSLLSRLECSNSGGSNSASARVESLVQIIGGTSIAVYWLIKLSASNGENDEFVFVPPLIFVIVVEVIPLIRMSFNSARTPLRSTNSGSPEN